MKSAVNKMKRRLENIIGAPTGFTLAELMLVVVIIGIMAAMAIPMFTRSMDKMKLNAAARGIVSDLRWARSQAISQRSQVGIFFNEGSKTYTIFIDTDDPSALAFDSAADSIIKTINYGNLGNVNSTFANDTIIFKSDGSSSNSGQFTAASADNYHSRTVDVLASTGRVKLIS